MAKLSAHGQEVFRVEKEGDVTDPARSTTWEKTTISLMSDGKILEKVVVRFKPSSYETKPRLHDYGWKKRAMLKPEGDPAKLLEAYLKKGYKLVNGPHYDRLRSDYKKIASKAIAARQKRAADAPRRAAEDARKNGAGFYVRNRYIGGNAFSLLMKGKTWATNFGPKEKAEDCLVNAEKTLAEYLQMKFTYLLPVQIVQAESRDHAERGEGTVWWSDSKIKVSEKQADDAAKAAPVDPRQLKLF